MKKTSILDIIIAMFLVLCGLICIIPILNTLAISFSDKSSVAQGLVGLIPVNFNLASYKAMLGDEQFWRSFGVSVLRVVLGTGINVFMCIIMGYPLSKSDKTFKKKKYYMWIILFTMLFSGGMIPTFMVVKNLHLLDTIWALVFPMAVPVFYVIVQMNFFRAIPEALEESAFLDGASPWKILWKIYVPLSKPAIATITLFSAVNHWNSFFDGKIYINSLTKMPLQTYIQSLSAEVNMSSMANMSAQELTNRMTMSSLTFNSAKVIVSIIPILLIYPYLQRYFVSGMVMGAVKE